MRIVHVIDTLQAGGAERIAVDLANALSDEGQIVFVCTTRAVGNLRDELRSAIAFSCLHRKKRWDGLLRFRKYVSDNKIDIVHAHGNSSAFFCVFSLFGKAVPIVHHDHNSVMANRRLLPEKIFLKRCDAWIAVSPAIATRARQKVGARNVVIMANPVDVSRFSAMPRNLSDTGILKGIVLANYRPEKDFQNLLMALANFNHEQSSFFIDCYGGNYTGTYRKTIDRSIDQLKVADKIKLHDSTPLTAEKLSMAHFGLLFSSTEGLPVSVLEYLASGLPVIVTDVGECGRIVRAASSGLVVPPGTPDALADAIRQLIANTRLEEWGLKGREYVLRNHSMGAFVAAVISLYDSLISTEHLKRE